MRPRRRQRLHRIKFKVNFNAASARKLFFIIQVNEARHFSESAPHDLPRLGRGHAPHRVPIFIIVGQHVVDLPVFQLAHVVLDGVACVAIDQ